jgi:pimeloyl-ACP methyl ester carboxylesterase
MIPKMPAGNPTTAAAAPELQRRALANQIHEKLKPFGIHPVDSGEGPPAPPISGVRRGLIAPEEEGVKIVTLLNVDGVLYWSGGAPPPSAGRRNRRAGLLSLFGGEPVTSVKLQSLGVNEIAQKLEEMDEKFTPQGPAKLRQIQNRAIVAGEVQPVESGKILLFVHGTFSNNDNLIAEINETPDGQKFLTDAERSYAQVLAFDHFTVSRSPILNALELARKFAASAASVDIVCHSRGGLVTRWFCEVLDQAPNRTRRAVLVGSPIAGTSLAAPDKLRSTLNLFTNLGAALGEGLSLVPFLSAAGAIMKLAFSVAGAATKVPLIDAGVAMIPGLCAQSRILNNNELKALLWPPKQLPQYHAVTSTFRPPAVGWEFWKVFCDWTQLASTAEDRIFPAANDLVVDTDSMTENIQVESTLTFGEADHVYHTIYFRQPKTIRFIRESLGMAEAAAAV